MSVLPFKTSDGYPARDARIVKAACYCGDEVFVGWRHSDILHQHFQPHGRKMVQECQGFVDQYGFWWNRYQSARIALRARQIPKLVPLLTSEDLWDVNGEPRTGPWAPGT